MDKETLETIENNELLKERSEHRDAIVAIQNVLHTKHGQVFFKYLFKNLDVGELPVPGLTGEFLHDRLGFLRAGQAIFKIACEANPEIAAILLSNLEKERYEDLLRQTQ